MMFTPSRYRYKPQNPSPTRRPSAKERLDELAALAKKQHLYDPPIRDPLMKRRSSNPLSTALRAQHIQTAGLVTESARACSYNSS